MDILIDLVPDPLSVRKRGYVECTAKATVGTNNGRNGTLCHEKIVENLIQRAACYLERKREVSVGFTPLKRSRPFINL